MPPPARWAASDGRTPPGADHPLSTVPQGHMGLGPGIHGIWRR